MAKYTDRNFTSLNQLRNAILEGQPVRVVDAPHGKPEAGGAFTVVGPHPATNTKTSWCATLVVRGGVVTGVL